MTIEAPTSRADTSAFHIIQAVVVYHSSTSPGRGPRTARGSSGARARCRRGRARSPSAGRWCPRRTARTAGGRTATGTDAGARRSRRAVRARTRAVDAPVAVLDVEDVPHARQRPATSDHLGARSTSLRAVAVAPGDEQHRRLDLANRSITLRGPNSTAQLVHTAPRPAVARNATSASGRSAGSRRPGRPAVRRGRRGRAGRGRPGHAAHPRSASTSGRVCDRPSTATRRRPRHQPQRVLGVVEHAPGNHGRRA